MKRKVVKFEVSDGVKPVRSEKRGRPWSLRLPYPINLPAGASRSVKLGVSCNLPSLVVAKGLVNLFPPDVDVHVTIEGPAQLGQNEVVGTLFVIDNLELEEVE